jgi:hypothetical protein
MQTVRNSEDIAGEKPNANRRAQTAKKGSLHDLLKTAR